MNTLFWLLIGYLLYLVISYPLKKFYLFLLKFNKPNRKETIYDKPGSVFFSIAVISWILFAVFSYITYIVFKSLIIPIYVDSGILSKLFNDIYKFLCLVF